MGSPIQTFVRSVCVQDAVVWESDGYDGQGNRKYRPPRGVKVRWDDIVENVVNQKGEEVLSSAKILVTEHLMLGWRIWLGSLGDAPDNPVRAKVPEIMRVERSPEFRSTENFVTVVYV